MGKSRFIAVIQINQYLTNNYTRKNSVFPILTTVNLLLPTPDHPARDSPMGMPSGKQRRHKGSTTQTAQRELPITKQLLETTCCHIYVTSLHSHATLWGRYYYQIHVE